MQLVNNKSLFSRTMGLEKNWKKFINYFMEEHTRCR